MIFAVLAICSCGKEQPIRLGFVGGLTGRVADLGISGRDGVILAVETINRQGGIHGRPVELIVQDDRQEEMVAREAVQALIDAGVVAIVGHMTSSMTVVTVPIVNAHQVVMMSPTTSTNELSHLDDYFFRVYPYSAQISEAMATYILEERGIDRLVVVYDTSNFAFSHSAFIALKRKFESLGGTIEKAVTFKSGPDTYFNDIAAQLIAVDADGLYLLANAMDTGMICQQLHKLSYEIPTFATDWSTTDEVVQFGGQAVDGLMFMQSVDHNNETPAFLKFREAYQKRFGRTPNFAATHAYNSAMVLFTALQQDDDPTRLKQTILDMRTFDGLQEPIRFDPYGDVIRKIHPFEIQDGEFVALKEQS